MSDELNPPRKLSQSERCLIFQIVENKLRLSMSDEYTNEITERIIDDVCDDIEISVGEIWNTDDIRLAIGRSILKKFGICT